MLEGAEASSTTSSDGSPLLEVLDPVPEEDDDVVVTVELEDGDLLTS
jgi:hypothetical protein